MPSQPCRVPSGRPNSLCQLSPLRAPSSPVSPQESCSLRVSVMFVGTMRSWQSPETPTDVP